MKKKEDKVHRIKDFMMNIIYSHDLKKSIDFYKKYFGFEIERDLGQLSVYGKAGNVNLWIIGGFKYCSTQGDTSHTSVVYYVEDIFLLFKKFKLDDVSTVQKEPVKMPNEMYWFQAFDPSGNILELVGEMELGKLNI
jgi:predicted enzyme related to lactoylglutathione lyase